MHQGVTNMQLGVTNVHLCVTMCNHADSTTYSVCHTMTYSDLSYQSAYTNNIKHTTEEDEGRWTFVILYVQHYTREHFRVKRRIASAQYRPSPFCHVDAMMNTLMTQVPADRPQ